MALYLAGLGINPPGSISQDAIKAARQCEFVYLEQYTNHLAPDLKKQLEELFGKRISLVDRETVEDESLLIAGAQSSDCCLLISGDPLVATTHINLLISAKKYRVRCVIVHSSSVLSAAASESGLQAYKFGQTTTIPHFRENYRPSSPLDVILSNQTLGLHTICLLDIDKELGPLSPQQACASLLDMQSAQGSKMDKDAKIVVLSRLGFSDQMVIYSTIGKIIDGKEGELKTPACLIVPGKLHFVEEEFLATHEKG